jgi:hypothetical protein
VPLRPNPVRPTPWAYDGVPGEGSIPAPLPPPLPFCTPHTNEIPPTDPSVQADYVRVVDLDIRASKSDVCAIRVVTISASAGRTRACNRGLV